MITLSDNTAADMLVDHLGIEAVNQRLRDLGCSVSRLETQNLPAEAGNRPPLAARITTPCEMGGLPRDLAEHKLAGPVSTWKMLHMLSAPQDRSMIPRCLPPGWQYAGKTGSNPDLRADVGLATSPAEGCSASIPKRLVPILKISVTPTEFSRVERVRPSTGSGNWRNIQRPSGCYGNGRNPYDWSLESPGTLVPVRLAQRLLSGTCTLRLAVSRRPTHTAGHDQPQSPTLRP